MPHTSKAVRRTSPYHPAYLPDDKEGCDADAPDAHNQDGDGHLRAQMSHGQRR